MQGRAGLLVLHRLIQGIQVLAHGISRLNRAPFNGCSIYDTSGSGDAARGNVGTFFHESIICTIFGVHLRSSARIRLLDRHGGVRGPGVVVVDRCEQHGGYGCSCGGCPQAGVRCFRVGFGVLRHDDVAVLCLAPNDFEDPVHKMTSPFELLMIR